MIRDRDYMADVGRWAASARLPTQDLV
jgi:hypothetical protein